MLLPDGNRIGQQDQTKRRQAEALFWADLVLDSYRQSLVLGNVWQVLSVYDSMIFQMLIMVGNPPTPLMMAESGMICS
jgi:hypothetical protein